MSFKGIFRKAGITIDGNTLTLRRDREGYINKTSSALTGFVRAGRVNLNMTAAASANKVECFKASITSDVKTGAWANAITGSIDYSGGGAAHGLAAAICAEMIPPNSSLERGGLYSLNCVFGCGSDSSWASAGPLAFIRFENWGTKPHFSANAFLFHLTGEAPAIGGLLSANSRTLRVRIGSTSKYLYLSDTEDDLGAFVVDSATFSSAVATGITLSGDMTTGILFTNTVEKGIDFTDATLTQGWSNAFIRCGSGDGAGADQHTVAVTDHYIPLQINIGSESGPTTPREVCAAMFRVDAITADQANSSCDVLALRAKIDKNVYAATCINADIEISSNIDVPTAAVQGIFVQMTGNGWITSPNDVNVLEVVYKQTSSGGGCNNVAMFHMNGVACEIDNILALVSGNGTVANGILITGALTTGISITSTVDKGIDFTSATLNQGWNNAFFACGSGNGDVGAQHEVSVTDFYIPIQVNIASIGSGPTEPSEVGAAMFRADAIDTDQGKTSLDVLMLRSKVDKNVYAATCINASQTITGNISVPTAAVQTVFIQMDGGGTITSPNDVNVLEVKYAQTSGGGGCNNVAQFYCMAHSGCAIDNIVDIVRGDGTVTNGIQIRGDLTTGISLASACTTGISIADSTTGISIDAASMTTGISITGTSTAVKGRGIKSAFIIAAPDHGDGYGANEMEFTITGLPTEATAALTAWINIENSISHTNYLCAQNNGIYSRTATLTNAKVIFGMRLMADVDSDPHRLCPFSIVSANGQAVDALFEVSDPNINMGWTEDAGETASLKTGVIPFYIDDSGAIGYVRIYSGTS